MSTESFYQQLKTCDLPVTEMLQMQYFTVVPSDWFVIIADVQNSTAAVVAGRHNDVNLVAAGSLIAALNIARSKAIEIPFFFSGDGGAILVPETMTDDVLAALTLHNENSKRTVGLTMHIGCIRVDEILSQGASLYIAKIQLTGYFRKAVILGNGLKVAEQKIKNASSSLTNPSLQGKALNLAGLQCRWDKVKPPLDENEIVCYLIEARNQGDQASIYRKVLLKVDEIYGSLERRSPLSINKLRLLTSLEKLEKEMKLKFGRWNIPYYLNVLFENIVGTFYFHFNLNLGSIRGREYLSQLIANADTLTIDGRINTIISGKMEKRKELIEFLDQQESGGELIYGHHISKESVMTCYIENMKDKHIHFIDGSDGGYTEASKELKKKLLTKPLIG